jgi:NAD-dependent dihydropyrimidine dehydrogenase PreA subunit
VTVHPVLDPSPESFALLALGALAHVGLDRSALRRVGPLQYVLQWLYAAGEPTVIRFTDWLIGQAWAQGTLPGRALLWSLSQLSRVLPHGVVVTTASASAFARFLEAAEGPKGARLAVGPCVCQHALSRHEEPHCKDVTLLYGAEIYSHLDRGYRLIDAEEAASIFERCGERGLVHTVDFCLQSGRWTFVVCNCDREICILTRVHALTGRFISPGPAVVRHDPGRCEGPAVCGRCVEACIFDACSADGEAVDVAEERCMGCGRCVDRCPGAMVMIPRQDYAWENEFPREIFEATKGPGGTTGG